MGLPVRQLGMTAVRALGAACALLCAGLLTAGPAGAQETLTPRGERVVMPPADLSPRGTASLRPAPQGPAPRAKEIPIPKLKPEGVRGAREVLFLPKPVNDAERLRPAAVSMVSFQPLIIEDAPQAPETAPSLPPSMALAPRAPGPVFQPLSVAAGPRQNPAVIRVAAAAPAVLVSNTPPGARPRVLVKNLF